jgi:hypothetical protein
MFFYRLVRCSKVTLIILRLAGALTLRVISPRTHREILPYFGQDVAMHGKRKSLALVLATALLLTNFQSHQFAAAKKKEAKPIPSASPKWPPPGFKGINGVYARVPGDEELLGILSASRSLRQRFEPCKTLACAPVIVASATGCEWWEITSNVRQVNDVTLLREKIGTLVTYAGGSEPEKLKAIFLISEVPVAPAISISGIRVICHRDEFDKPKPGNIYTKVEVAG